MTSGARVVLLLLFALVLVARLCHIDLLWIEEAYPTAAAAEILRGKLLYRDIWFDKPPLYALVYLLWGAKTGLVLRLAGALYVIGCSVLAYLCALQRWGRREALLAAAFVSLFLTFGIPSAVMALAPDLLMIAPHLGAILLAWRGRPFWSGVVAGIALLCNVKGLFVLLAVLLFVPYRNWPRVAAGWALPVSVFAAVLWAGSAWTPYVDQVWRWGLLYSSDPVSSTPVLEGLQRTLNWSWFHLSLVIGAGLYLCRERDWRMAAWLLLSLVAIAGGWRFFPRYYFHLLAPAALAAARGISTARPAVRMALLALLLIPVVRFGPRYVQLALDRSHRWSDLAMMEDSRKAANWLRSRAKPSDTLLVWGYRPDMQVFSGLPAATRFLDSQPLTGVLADRHLTSSRPTVLDWAARNRSEIYGTKPIWIADGLGPYNAELAVTRFLPMMAHYDVVYQTGGFVLYRRKP